MGKRGVIMSTLSDKDTTQRWNALLWGHATNDQVYFPNLKLSLHMALIHKEKTCMALPRPFQPMAAKN